MTKRAFDILAAAVAIVVSSPAWVVAALLIRREDSGPVFFEQERVGRFGRPFRIRKFRSMVATVGGASVTAAGDARITRVGGILRSTKLDELPQLLNVLRGEMSLVGPRPELREYVDLWPPDSRERILSVRPGITDPASVRFRWEADLLAEAPDADLMYRATILPAKVAAYEDYVASMSFLTDMRILFRTVRAVFSSRWEVTDG